VRAREVFFVRGGGECPGGYYSNEQVVELSNAKRTQTSELLYVDSDSDAPQARGPRRSATGSEHRTPLNLLKNKTDLSFYF
jgi:hypothetical protein